MAFSSRIACALFVASLGMSGVAATAASGNKANATTSANIATATRGTQRIAGFFDVYSDAAKGRVLLGVQAFDEPFLLITSLPWALGFNDIGLDRGQSSGAYLVEFRCVGSRVLLVEDNTRFCAVSPHPDEPLIVRQAFAESVLWAGDIVGEDKGSAGVVVDITSLLTSDRHGIARQLADTNQGKYELDEKRSAVSLKDAKSFPDNTELEALLTFKGPGEPN